MNHTKYGPMNISTGPNGEEITYTLGIIGNGKSFKKAQYWIVVDHASDATNGTLGLNLDHGPDGVNFQNHSSPIPVATLSSCPKLLQASVSDSTTMIGEYRKLNMVIGDARQPGSKTLQTMTVTVYETVKPF